MPPTLQKSKVAHDVRLDERAVAVLGALAELASLSKTAAGRQSAASDLGVRVRPKTYMAVGLNELTVSPCTVSGCFLVASDEKRDE